jgi:hypothetical protein
MDLKINLPPRGHTIVPFPGKIGKKTFSGIWRYKSGMFVWV